MTPSKRTRRWRLTVISSSTFVTAIKLSDDYEDRRLTSTVVICKAVTNITTLPNKACMFTAELQWFSSVTQGGTEKTAQSLSCN